MRSNRILRALCVGLLATAAGACEGDNLFSGDTPELLPRVSNLSAPPTVAAGDTMFVRVDAFAPHGVAQISVSLEGAVTRDTVVEITAARTQVSQSIRVPIPAVFSDTLLTVSASVADRLGNVSVTRTTQVVAFGPPMVSLVSAPPSVRAGDVVNLEVRVTGARRVTRVQYDIRGAFNKDTSIAVLPAQKSITQTLTLQVPLVVQDTILTVNITAWDESGFANAPRVVDIPLAIDPPVLNIDVAAQARAGDRLEVHVTATGLRKVSQIRVELRGAVVKDTTVAADPTRSSFAQTIAVQLPGAITSSDLAVHVFAIDTGDAISATRSVNVHIPTERPVVFDIDMPGGVFAGQTADVRVYAQADRPLSRIDVRFRGAVDVDRVFTVTPQRHYVEQDASVLVPENPKDFVLIVHATATDVTGDISTVVTRVVTVTVPDTTTSGGVNVSSAAARPALSQTVDRLAETLDARIVIAQPGALRQSARISSERERRRP